MYQNDSFFSLGAGGQIGLAALSFVMVLGVALLAWRLMRGRGMAWGLVLAVILYALFVWLSPQVYYTYYRMIFEGLPAQWVIGWPPVEEMLRKASFSGRATLSAHGQGALFWVLVGLAITGAVRRGLKR